MDERHSNLRSPVSTVSRFKSRPLHDTMPVRLSASSLNVPVALHQQPNVPPTSIVSMSSVSKTKIEKLIAQALCDSSTAASFCDANLKDEGVCYVLSICLLVSFKIILLH